MVLHIPGTAVLVGTAELREQTILGLTAGRECHHFRLAEVAVVPCRLGGREADVASFRVHLLDEVLAQLEQNLALVGGVGGAIAFGVVVFKQEEPEDEERSQRGLARLTGHEVVGLGADAAVVVVRTHEQHRRGELVGLERRQSVLLLALKSAELEELVGLVDFLHLVDVERIGRQHPQELAYAEQLIEIGVVSRQLRRVHDIVSETDVDGAHLDVVGVGRHGTDDVGLAPLLDLFCLFVFHYFNASASLSIGLSSLLAAGSVLAAALAAVKPSALAY